MDYRVYSIPMAVPFRGLTRREGMLIRGDAGWAEWSPFPEYAPPEAARWLKAALEAANQGFPAPLRTSIEVNVTIPATNPVSAFHLAQASGARTAKVKVAAPGGSLAEDLARLEAVRDALGPEARIRVDANAAWSLDEADKAIRAMRAFGLEYVEQPCASPEELASLRRLVDVPIAADESIRRSADPYRLKALEAADVFVLKVHPLEGVTACLQLVERLQTDEVVVSSAVETSIGLRAGLALAGALPELHYACGLGTATLLSADVVSDPLIAVDGYLELRDVQLDEDCLNAVSADADTTRFWTTRLADCMEQIG